MASYITEDTIKKKYNEFRTPYEAAQNEVNQRYDSAAQSLGGIRDNFQREAGLNYQDSLSRSPSLTRTQQHKLTTSYGNRTIRNATDYRQGVAKQGLAKDNASTALSHEISALNQAEAAEQQYAAKVRAQIAAQNAARTKQAKEQEELKKLYEQYTATQKQDASKLAANAATHLVNKIGIGFKDNANSMPNYATAISPEYINKKGDAFIMSRVADAVAAAAPRAVQSESPEIRQTRIEEPWSEINQQRLMQLVELYGMTGGKMNPDQLQEMDMLLDHSYHQTMLAHGIAPEDMPTYLSVTNFDVNNPPPMFSDEDEAALKTAEGEDKVILQYKKALWNNWVDFYYKQPENWTDEKENRLIELRGKLGNKNDGYEEYGKNWQEYQQLLSERDTNSPHAGGNYFPEDPSKATWVDYLVNNLIGGAETSIESSTNALKMARARSEDELNNTAKNEALVQYKQRMQEASEYYGIPYDEIGIQDVNNYLSETGNGTDAEIFNYATGVQAGYIPFVGAPGGDTTGDTIRSNMSTDVADRYQNLYDSYGVDEKSMLGIGGNVAQGIGGMLPAIAINAATGGAAGGLSFIFLNSMGSASTDALQQGADPEDALIYGMTTGAIEVGTEVIFGGVPGLGSGAADIAIDSVTNKMKSESAQALVRLAMETAGEGVEEAVAEYVGIYTKRIYDENADIELTPERWADIAYAALIGSLTSVIMQGGQIDVNKLFGNTNPDTSITFQTDPETGELFLNNPNSQQANFKPSDAEYWEGYVNSSLPTDQKIFLATNEQFRSAFEEITGALLPPTIGETIDVYDDYKLQQLNQAVEAQEQIKESLGHAPGEQVSPEQIGAEAADAIMVQQTQAAVNDAVTVTEAPTMRPLDQSVYDEIQSIPADQQLSLEEQADLYGQHSDAQNPAAEFVVPKQATEEYANSRTLMLLMQNEHMPEEIRVKAQRQVQGGIAAYEVAHNEDLIKSADSIIKSKGITDAADTVRSAFEDINAKDGVAGLSAQNTVLAIEVMNKALESGDYGMATDMAAIYCSSQHANAQGLQASRILLNTPEGKVVGLNRAIQQMESDYKSKFGNKFNGFGITDEMVGNYYEAVKDGDKSAIKTAEDAIGKQIVYNTPVGIRAVDFLNSVRYMAMLTNTRTHIRNIMGNTGQYLMANVKNVIGTGLESTYQKLVDSDMERTKAILTPKDWSNIQYSWDLFNEVTDKALGSRKLQGTNVENYEFLKRSVFKDNFNDKLLNWEDKMFQQLNFTTEAAMFMKANKYTTELMNSDTTEGRRAKAKVIAYAEEQALKNTYRNQSKLADNLSKLSKDGGIAGFIVDSVAPFTNTPINIAKTGIQYSPIGFIKGMKQLFVDVPNGTIIAAAAIDNIASGLTGSGVFALGLMLAKAGILTAGRNDKSKKEKAYDSMLGGQDYSIKLGDTYYSLSWMMPAAFPLFMGAEFASMDKNGGVMDALIGAGTGALGVLVDMSVLEGVDQLLKDISYSENPVEGLIPAILKNYINQFIPSELGNIARIADPVRRDPYAGAENEWEVWGNQIKTRIPGLSQTVEPYIDAWGREDKPQNENQELWNLFENIVSPGYASTRNETAVDDYLQELSRELENAGTDDIETKEFQEKILPQRYQVKNVKVGGETGKLTPAEQTHFAKVRGQTAHLIIEGLMSNEQFKGLSATERADIIANAYSVSTAVAKSKIGADVSDGWDGKKIIDLNEQGLSYEDIIMYRAFVDADGNSSITQDEAKYAIDGMTWLSNKQKSALWVATNKGWKTNPYDGTETSGSGSDRGSSSSSGSGTVNLQKLLKEFDTAMRSKTNKSFNLPSQPTTVQEALSYIASGKVNPYISGGGVKKKPPRV